MTPVNPQLIIEQQLERLKTLSEKGSLTFDEIKALEALVKLQIVLRLKGESDKNADGDPYADITSEQLKAMLPFLG